MNKVTFSIISLFAFLLSGLSNLTYGREAKLIFEATFGQPIDHKYLSAKNSDVIWNCFPFVGCADANGNIVLYDPKDKAVTRMAKDGKYIDMTALGNGLDVNCRDLMHFIGVDHSNNLILYVPLFNGRTVGRDNRTSLIVFNFMGELLDVKRILGIPFDNKYDYTGFLQPDGNIVFTNRHLGTYLLQPSGEFVNNTQAKHSDYLGNGYGFKQHSTKYNEQTSVTLFPAEKDINKIDVAAKNDRNLIDTYVKAIGVANESFFTIWMGSNEENDVAFRIERASKKDHAGLKEFEYLILDAKTQNIREHGVHKWHRSAGMSPLLLFSYLDSEGDIVICNQEPLVPWSSEPPKGAEIEKQGPTSVLRIYLLSK